MKCFEKILMYLNADGEPNPALEIAKQYARDQGAHLTLVDVVDDTGWDLAHAIRPEWKFHEILLKARYWQLESIQRGLLAEGLSVSCKLLVGQPSIEIIRQVLRGKHDLVMKTARPDPRERGLSYGTVALRLLRMCPCSLWILQPTLHETRHVLAAVDPSKDANGLGFRILELASRLSQWYKSELHVVHAWGGQVISLFEGAFAGEDLSTALLDLHSNVEKHLQALVAKLPTRVPSENVHLIKGEAHREIPRFIKQTDIDLVVMGTVARHGLAGLIIGNTAERLLRRMSCSLLAIKPEGFVSQINLDEPTAKHQ